MHKVDVNIITQKEYDRRFFFCDGLTEITKKEKLLRMKTIEKDSR